MALVEGTVETTRPIVDESVPVVIRDEGVSNLIVSGRTAEGGRRVIWRFRRSYGRSQKLNENSYAYAEMCQNYIASRIQPLLGDYVTVPAVVTFPVQDIRKLGIAELLSTKGGSVNSLKSITALEMPDCTFLNGSDVEGARITFEVKPKQGTVPPEESTNSGTLPYCNNCLLQMDKFCTGMYSDLYAYCPLDLFSGDFKRMGDAVWHLVRSPHNNLRIFENGGKIHSKESPATVETLDETIRRTLDIRLDQFIGAFCQILSGCAEKENRSDNSLRENSVLGRILSGQKKGALMGIETALRSYNTLSEELRLEFEADPYSLFKDEQCSTELCALRDFVIGLTLRDCSVMVTVQKNTKLRSSPQRGTCLIQVPDSDVTLRYAISVIDLDAKSLNRLPRMCKRLYSGMSFAKQHSKDYCSFRKPCF